MVDEPPSSGPEPPFSEPHSHEFPGEESAEFGTLPNQTQGRWSQAAFAFSAAKHWVREHQKASMLGALAAGVFIGVLIRD